MKAIVHACISIVHPGRRQDVLAYIISFLEELKYVAVPRDYALCRRSGLPV